MKTITTLAFLAALAAFLFAPISLELAGSLLFATGLASILAADYSRRIRLTARRMAPVVGLKPMPVAQRPAGVRFELAA